MRRLLAARLLHAVVVVLAVATITFVLVHLAPGDPFTAQMENPHLTPEAREAWRRQWGYDRPLPEQYARYLASVARGDLGFSHVHNRWVRDVLADALPRTLVLMSLALAASFGIGMGVGVWQARRHGSAADQAVGALSLVFYSVPDFWLATVLLVAFTQELGVLPAGGLADPLAMHLPPMERLLDRARHLVLPVGTLVLLTTAAVARHQRAAMLEAAGRDFARTARAKGASEARVMRRHVWRNALLPVITLLGLAFPALLGGAVFIETVFGIPGMGYVTVAAIGARDYALVLASVIVGAVMVVAGSLLADLLAAAADPRLRAG